MNDSGKLTYEEMLKELTGDRIKTNLRKDWDFPIGKKWAMVEKMMKNE